MAKFIFFLTFVSISSASLSEIYKCSNANGSFVFQEIPCDGLKSEVYEATQSSVIANDNTPVDSTLYQDRYDSSEKAVSDYRARNDQIRRETSEKICKLYTDRLTSLEEEWENIRRKGYKQSERERYQRWIGQAENDVENNC
jgi:hypothetical protein